MIKLNRLQLVTALLGMLLVVAGVYFFALGQKGPKLQVAPQEFKELKVVQGYLHMQGQDYIIDRAKPAFTKVVKASEQAVLSISQGLPGEIKDIRPLESKTLSLTVWLLEPQKLSTKMKTKKAASHDKYGNDLLLTDRVLFILSGEQKGKIYTRKPSNGSWQAWTTDGEGLNQLVELIRAGGL